MLFVTNGAKNPHYITNAWLTGKPFRRLIMIWYCLGIAVSLGVVAAVIAYRRLTGAVRGLAFSLPRPNPPAPKPEDSDDALDDRSDETWYR